MPRHNTEVMSDVYLLLGRYAQMASVFRKEPLINASYSPVGYGLHSTEGQEHVPLPYGIVRGIGDAQACV